jgi:hypothetical protein
VKTPAKVPKVPLGSGLPELARVLGDALSAFIQYGSLWKIETGNITLSGLLSFLKILAKQLLQI